MTLIPSLNPDQSKQLRNVILGYIAWVVLSIIAWLFILPDGLKWVAYAPIAFIIMVLMIAVFAIVARPMLSRPIEFVYVGRHRVTCCQFCPMVEIKDNIVNNKFPVVKCMETAKVCYNPMKIPGWCPYAKK